MKIGVVGGGASGIMAAITAADYGAEVTILEKNDRIGKKILATGNGKCNFTNKSLKNTDYNSQTANIYDDYISQYDQEWVLSFFADKGMLAKERNGYYYPRSEQASTILDILRKKLQESGVKILTMACPRAIISKAPGFTVCLNEQELYFDRLILACGSFAGERKQNEFSGYHYAKKLGHTLIPVVPALVQLRAKDKEFRSISGVRCEAEVALYIDGKSVSTECGELQLTDYGISGIPVFQLSRFAAYGLYEKRLVTAIIDFLPEYDRKCWRAVVEQKWNACPKSATVEEFFLGFLHKKLNGMFIRLENLKPGMPLKACSFEQIWRACLRIKGWEVHIESTNPFEYAQVCAGGVSMEEVSLKLESLKQRGLFFAGEMLDVDGRCGGYNLQWAWTSGYLAGKYAAEKNEQHLR